MNVMKFDMHHGVLETVRVYLEEFTDFTLDSFRTLMGHGRKERVLFNIFSIPDMLLFRN